MLNANQLTSKRRRSAGLSKTTRRKTARIGLLLANVLVLVLVVGFVLAGRNSGASSLASQSLLTGQSNAINPLDQLSSADIAVQLARAANLAEASAVANQADTVNAQLMVSSPSVTVVAKPEIVASGLKSRRDIQTYTVKPGDTIPSIAAQFGITSDTIRWSNGISGDVVAAGKQLLISPVNGILYQVKAGDTTASLASKYHANEQLLIAINDAEISGLPPAGQYIIIPGGSPATVATPRFVTAGFAWGGSGAIYSGNGYDLGNCTWWAANRRAQIGRPIPSNLGNASTWKVLSQSAGMAGGSAPQAGAVIWFPPHDYYGHVGFVESVNGDGSANISEMNVYGWNVVNRTTIPANQVGNYYYIY